MPFSAADPVRTPNTLNTAAPGFARALADTVTELRAAGIALDAPLGRDQFVVRGGGKRIPVPGGTESLGVWNKIEPVWNAAAGGYTRGHHGFEPHPGGRLGRQPLPGGPDAAHVLPVVESELGRTTRDQTRLFSREQWVTSRFCEKDILSSPALKVVRVHE